MKRFLSVMLALVTVCALLPTAVFAAKATFTLSGPSQVTMGKELSLTVQLSAPEKIKEWKYSIEYDPAILEYVEGGDSGGAGAVTFNGQEESNSKAKATLKNTVTFRTRKIGEVSFSLIDAEVLGFSSETPMTLNAPTKKISVVATPNRSEENLLESLSVSEGKLDPEFDPEKTEYAVTVPYESTSVTVAAKTKDGKATVNLSKTDDLKVGENTVNVEVVAENGTPRVYVLKVTRENSDLAGVTVELDGKTYEAAYDPATLTVPSGYKPETVPYGDQKLLAFTAPQGGLRIVYLTEGENGAWYIYDEAEKSFAEYLSANSASATVIIMTPSEEIEIPKGFEPHKLTVGDKTWPVFKADHSEEEGIWLVYGMNVNGERVFYFYDSNLKTFSSYYEPIRDKSAEEAAAKEVKELRQDLKESEKAADQMEILFLAAAVVAVILLIAMVALLALRTKKPAGKKEKKKPVKESKKEVQDFETISELAEKKAEKDAAAKEIPVESDVPGAEAPKRRRAKRTLDDVAPKTEAVPAIQMEEVKPAEEAKPQESEAPAEEAQTVEPEKSEPNKESQPENFSSFDDMPPILR